MTDIAPQTELPFIDIIKRSFSYFIKNLNPYFKLATMGLVVVLFDMLTGFSTICSLRGVDCPNNWQQSVSTLLLMITSASMVILYCRNIVLKTFNIDWINLLKITLIFLIYNVALLIAIAIPSIFLMFVYGIVFSNMINSFILNNLIYLIPLFIAIIASPLFLMFPAIALEDNSFKIKQLFKLAKGNYNKIFWGQFIMMIPAAIIVIALTFLYQAIGIDNYFVNEIFTILVIALSLADSALKASFYAHIYNFFKALQKAEE